MKTQINKTSPVQCTKSIFINARRELVWDILTNINAWPQWQADISNASIEKPLAPGSNFRWKTGGVKIHSTLHTVSLNAEFGWTGKTFGLFAIHNWSLEENNGGTLLHVAESMDGILAVLFKKSFNRNLEKGMLLWINLLKRKCENQD